MRHMIIALGPSGVNGVLRLFGFQVLQQLRLFVQELLITDQTDKSITQIYLTVEKELDPVDTLPPNFAKLYPSIISRFSRSTSLLSEILCRIGQLQQVHHQLSLELDFWKGSESTLYTFAASTLEQAVSYQVQQSFSLHTEKFASLVKPSNSLVTDLSDVLPGTLAERVFPLSLDEIDQRLPLLLFMNALGQLGKFSWNEGASMC
jgi:hypothetical protein